MQEDTRAKIMKQGQVQSGASSPFCPSPHVSCGHLAPTQKPISSH